MSELLPCPFCGAHATQPENVRPGKTPLWEISCAIFCSDIRRSTKTEVTRDWNRRADIAPTQGADARTFVGKWRDAIKAMPDTYEHPGGDARPVAIYQKAVDTNLGIWKDITQGLYNGVGRDHRRIVYATRDAAPSDAPKEDAKRLKQLEHALVYVAHSMHSEPQYMLAEGITLGDVSFVRVKIADIDVSVDLPESVARAMYDAAMQATVTKDEERRIAITPRRKT